jgi:hypothetical protein
VPVNKLRVAAGKRGASFGLPVVQPAQLGWPGASAGYGVSANSGPISGAVGSTNPTRGEAKRPVPNQGPGASHARPSRHRPCPESGTILTVSVSPSRLPQA